MVGRDNLEDIDVMEGKLLCNGIKESFLIHVIISQLDRAHREVMDTEYLEILRNYFLKIFCYTLFIEEIDFPAAVSNREVSIEIILSEGEERRDGVLAFSWSYEAHECYLWYGADLIMRISDVIVRETIWALHPRECHFDGMGWGEFASLFFDKRADVFSESGEVEIVIMEGILEERLIMDDILDDFTYTYHMFCL